MQALRIGAIVGAVAVVVWALVLVRSVVTPFAIAFAVAYFLNPLVNILERGFERLLAKTRVLRNLTYPRTLAVGVLCIWVVSVLALLLVIAVPAAFQQIEETVAKAPGWVETVRAKLEPLIAKLSERYPEQAAAARVQVEKALKEHAFTIVGRITQMVQKAVTNVLSVVAGVFNVMIVPIFAVYLLYDMNRIRTGAAELVPLRYRTYVYSRLRQIDQLLSAFARGQLTVCLILGTFYAIALTVCGVPMGLLVGMVIGFFNLIPFMSTLLGLPLAVSLSLLDDQSLRQALMVVGVFFFGQAVEGNFITPRIVGQGLGLHAVIVMLAVLVGGSLFGFVGMLIAVPATAALSVFWADLRALYLRSEFYRRGAPEDVPAGEPVPPSATPSAE
jgi:predicted PurR-regulated permease PerM